MNSEENKKPVTNAVQESVNDQITDAVTQSNVKIIDEAPALALGNVYQSAAHSTGLMFENAVNTQNQQNILGQAATTQGVMQIYSMDTVADAISIERMLNPTSAKVEPEHDENQIDDEEGDKGGNGNAGGGNGGTGSGGTGGNG